MIGLIQVGVIEDNEHLLKQYVQRLKKDNDIKVIGVATSKDCGLQFAEEQMPDVLFVDINLEGGNDQLGIEIAIELSVKQPSIKIIMLSSLLTVDTVRSTLGLGVAVRYLVKGDNDNLPLVAKEVMNPDVKHITINASVYKTMLYDYSEALKTTFDLTPTLKKVLELFYRGYSVGEVSDKMQLEMQTVANYRQAIARKCLGWQYALTHKKLTTEELARRAKKLNLF